MSLWRVILPRLAWGLGLVILMTALVFIIFNVLPTGDPAELRTGASPGQIEEVREALGRDQPVYAQYADFLGDLAHLDLGTSYRYGVPVTELIADRLPATLMLMSMAALVWILAGVLFGVLAAARPGTALDRLGGVGSLALISLPVFVLGYVMLLLFAVGSDALIPVLPGVGAYLEADDFPSRLAALILPALALGLCSAGTYFRLSRARIGEELQRYSVLGARARGVEEDRILWRHAFRAGLSPMLTLIGLDFALAAAGNVVLVEAVFNVPGVGGLLVSAIQRSDLPVIEGVVIFTSVMVIVVNIGVDIFQSRVDPRIKQPGLMSSTTSNQGSAGSARGPSPSS